MNDEPKPIEWWQPIDDSVTDEDIKRRIEELEGPDIGATNCRVETKEGQRFIACVFPPPSG